MCSRWLLLALLFVAACSGGGSGSSSDVPVLDWQSFRHDGFNSGAGHGSVRSNDGTVELLNGDLGGTTLSTPTIGQNNRMYLGTANGLLALDAKTGAVRWRLETCNLTGDSEACTPDTCIEIGRIESSATVTADNDIVFGSGDGETDPGYIFRVHDENDTPQCIWAFRPQGALPGFHVKSSPVTIIDGNDFSLISVFVGGSDGVLQAINGDGTDKWRFPRTTNGVAGLTSSPALSFGGTILIYTPDGFVRALDLSGRLLWSFEVGVIDQPHALLPSPVLGTAAYSIGANRGVSAINQNGSLNWRRQTAALVPGSPAIAGQFLQELRCTESNVMCIVDADCPVETCQEGGTCTQSGKNCSTDEDCPDETCRNVSIFENIVQLVDADGTIYGFRDTTGAILVLQRCSDTNSDTECDADNDCPSGEVCENKPAERPLSSEGPIAVRSSPAISGDLFVVAASEDGLVCARTLDGRVPDDAVWETGCVSIGANNHVRSSPVVGGNGEIYVTTDLGLYMIK